MAAPSTGMESVMPSTENAVFVNSGFMVTLPGAIATSSKPYARLSSFNSAPPHIN